MKEYRIKKYYSKLTSRWAYIPQFKDRFLFWTFWRNLVDHGFYDVVDAEIEIDKSIKDFTDAWPKDEIIEYPRTIK